MYITFNFQALRVMPVDSLLFYDLCLAAERYLLLIRPDNSFTLIEEDIRSLR